jgi:hypothetical protein
MKPNSILILAFLLLELGSGLQRVLILIRGEHFGVPTTLIGSKKLFSIAPTNGFRLYSVASFAKVLFLTSGLELP